MDEQNQQQNQAPAPQQPDQPQKPAGPPTGGKGYGKRPLWQWIVLYVVIGGALYAVIYFLFFRGGAGY